MKKLAIALAILFLALAYYADYRANRLPLTSTSELEIMIDSYNQKSEAFEDSLKAFKNNVKKSDSIIAIFYNNPTVKKILDSINKDEEENTKSVQLELNDDVFEEINGMLLAGPDNNYKLVGRLQWENKLNSNEFISVIDIEGEYDSALFLEENKNECIKGTRGTEYIDSKEIKVQGTNMFTCFQKGVNGLAIAQTYIQKEGYVYYIIASADPDKYDNAAYITSYMYSKILNQL